MKGGISMKMKKSALALLLLAALILPSCSKQTSDENADFGLVGVYSPADAVEITDCTGDTDALLATEILPTVSDGVYSDYMKGAYGEQNPADGLTLHVRLAAVGDDTVLLTSSVGDDTPFPDEPFGYIERLGEDGGWAKLGAIEYIYSNALTYLSSVVSEPTALKLSSGLAVEVGIRFPLHEPGTYRITYYYRAAEYDGGYMGWTYSEPRSISHTVTVPEASGRKFDLISADIGAHEITDDGSFVLYIGALCRSNDGAVPYQDLLATRLEVYSAGRWAPAPSDGYSAVTGLRDEESENPFYSPSAYYTEDPFTGEDVTNVICGTAEVTLSDPSARYRLTMEFCENPDGSGERWILTLYLIGGSAPDEIVHID